MKRGAGEKIKQLLALVGTTCKECVDFDGAIRDGYGRVTYNGKDHNANRLMCTLAHGEPPSPDLEACHSCHNRACINPNHLRWGTRKENHIDKALNGTTYGQKLTASQAKEIFESREPSAAVARRFGVSPNLVCNIKKGRAWAHVTKAAA